MARGAPAGACRGMSGNGKKRALVTGASGSLGGHFAKTLARAGMDVALAARRIEALRSTIEEIKAIGAEALAVEMDVTDSASVARAMDMISDELGELNVLVNNAGIATMRPLLEQTDDDWNRVLEVNLTGAWRVAQATAKQMAASGNGGSIINIASILGLRVAGQVPAYAASKAALIHLTRAMALELAPYRIRVNAIAPGYIRTDINREFFTSKAGEALVHRIPQRRLGEPEDLDGPLLLLASEASVYMTGAVIPVDGGHLCSAL
jgi:NAD(P)-dependent dehydrogenase (short-subunit alcohol dehydrogenase family)